MPHPVDSGLFGIPNKYYKQLGTTLSSTDGRWFLFKLVDQSAPLFPAVQGLNSLAKACTTYVDLSDTVQIFPDTLRLIFSYELFETMKSKDVQKSVFSSALLVLDTLTVVGSLGAWGILDLAAISSSLGSLQVFGVCPLFFAMQLPLLEVTIVVYLVVLTAELARCVSVFSQANFSTMDQKEKSGLYLGTTGIVFKIGQQVLFLAVSTTSPILYATLGTISAGFGLGKEFVKNGQ